MQIQWYPGHMTKARRAIQQDMALVDMVIELLDARAPASSRNPDIDTLARGKARIVLLNKADLAEPEKTAAWREWFASRGMLVVELNARSGSGVKEVSKAITRASQEKTERDRKRGILNRPVRVMVVGIPNVGKSTLINSLARKASAKTGNKPGVTRGNQWIRLNKTIELLDTPGILWPKFDDDEVGCRLAAISSIREEVVDRQELACWLIDFMRTVYPGRLTERYEVSEEGKPYEVLEAIAKARHALGRGGEGDMERAAAILLDDFRMSRLGLITMETPPEE